jgi:hypothetical protein
MVRGRIRVDKEGLFKKDANEEFESRGSRSAEAIARWIETDYRLATKCGFIAVDRK